MASIVKDVKCEVCGKNHDFCIDDLFSATADYEYVCPESQKKGIFRNFPAANSISRCPIDSVVVKRVDPMR